MNNSLLRFARREFRHVFHALHPESRRKAARWMNADGPALLRAIGVNRGDVVVDFGCGPGFFSLPAAQVTGDGGLVFALDKSPRALRKVRRRAAARALRNLCVGSSMLEVLTNLNGRPCDFVLLYDMLHFLDLRERRELYSGLRNVLAANGRLSVHLTHVKDHEPGGHFAEMTADDVVREIEMAGFCQFGKIPARVWHSYGAVDSVIWNFVKR